MNQSVNEFVTYDARCFCLDLCALLLGEEAFPFHPAIKTRSCTDTKHIPINSRRTYDFIVVPQSLSTFLALEAAMTMDSKEDPESRCLVFCFEAALSRGSYRIYRRTEKFSTFVCATHTAESLKEASELIQSLGDAVVSGHLQKWKLDGTIRINDALRDFMTNERARLKHEIEANLLNSMPDREVSYGWFSRSSARRNTTFLYRKPGAESPVKVTTVTSQCLVSSAAHLPDLEFQGQVDKLLSKILVDGGLFEPIQTWFD